MHNKYEQFKKMLRSMFSISLVLFQTLLFSYVWMTEYNNQIIIPYAGKGNWLFFAIYAMFYIIFVRSFDGFKYGIYRKANLITGQILASVSTAFVTYLQIVLLSARFVTFIPIIYMVLGNTAIILLLIFSCEFLWRKLFPPKKTLIIYENYSPETFMLKLNARKDKFCVEKIINISECIDEIEKSIAGMDSVIIYDVHSEKRNKILKICFENNIRTYSTTKVSDILVRGSECIHLFDTPLLLYRNIGLTIEQKILKRAMDIVVSGVMLILASPFMLLSALAIKLYDGGPVFFRQARGTINGKVFYIRKFRSMIVDAEKDGKPHPAEENDPRITPVGKVLRATRLDELPQLIDILIGNMSLVGPRPERVEHIEKYTEDIPEFQYRLKVKGGLTGFAQLYGKYNTSSYDKLLLDLMYIQNYSIFLDIRLILMTLKIMFMKESTEGFENKDQEKSETK